MAKFGSQRPYVSFWRSQRFADDVYGSQVAPAVGHYPYVRPLQLDWELTPIGYRAHDKHPDLHEVLCAGCGDGDGPAELQPDAARRLRGPYATAREARGVAVEHERSMLPTRAEAKAAAGGGMLRVLFPSTKLTRALGSYLRPQLRPESGTGRP